MNNHPEEELHAYSVDLNLHHPSCDPGVITNALSMEPWFVKRQGDFIGEIQHRLTTWLCRFQKGVGNVAFNQTLEDIASFLVRNQAFLSSFADEEGTIELVLNATVPVDKGKLFQLRLDPWFLGELSQRNVMLRMQVWSK